MYTPPENITKWMENSSEQRSVKSEEYEIIDVVGEIETSQGQYPTSDIEDFIYI